MNPLIKKTSLLIPLACGLVPAPGAAPVAKPNIVLILADDLGYGELSISGQRRYDTPNIDRLARDGMIFTQAYAGSPVCAPSRNTLMTGHHTGHATVRNNTSVKGARVGLSPADTTIAQRLRSAGYHTAIIGKWGLGEEGGGSEPGNKGWDFFYGFINQAHAHNQFPEFLYRGTDKEALVPNYSHAEGTFANDRFTEEALTVLERRAADRQPFFLFMSYTTPHAELRCPPDSIAKVKQKYAWAREPGADEKSIQFAAMMLRLDHEVGRLRDRLAELGLAENTLILFTGDNGAHQEDGKNPVFFNSGGIYRGIKRDLYEGGIHEPFFACWPGRIAPGSRTDHLCAFWDFSATALELAGVAATDLPAESISFLPTLLGRPTEQKKHDYLYWEFVVKTQARQAARADNWKAVRYSLDAPLEIYDIIADPGEQHDLAATRPDLVARFAEIMRHAHTESSDFPLRPPPSAGKASSKK
ncbi:arylsulfatase [Termitidicoccus mucosus]|uniref:Sulfatase N-terminal domain-containing protein n=1 Tax=Termitidicoccus mucosus TaxID=1184151 RepID=A0A178IJH8_9BACT|nr:hypothetical protein AW736_09635 [Opitutaceae bacterium TSB47]